MCHQSLVRFTAAAVFFAVMSGAVSYVAGRASDGSSTSKHSGTLTSISVDPAKQIIPTGGAHQFVALGRYRDSTTRDLSDSVIWSSSNDVVFINVAGKRGLVGAVRPGNALFTASDPSSHIQGSAIITVTPPVLLSIDVIPPLLNLSKGTTAPLSASGVYSDGSSRDLTASVKWNSSSSNATDLRAEVNNAY
jgi:hypothetical protein